MFDCFLHRFICLLHLSLDCEIVQKFNEKMADLDDLELDFTKSCLNSFPVQVSCKTKKITMKDISKSDIRNFIVFIKCFLLSLPIDDVDVVVVVAGVVVDTVSAVFDVAGVVVDDAVVYVAGVVDTVDVDGGVIDVGVAGVVVVVAFSIAFHLVPHLSWLR